MIVPSGVHVPPRNNSTAHRTTGDDVASTLVLFSLSSAQKAIDFPSGEKRGVSPPSVPGSATLRSWSRRRKNNRLVSMGPSLAAKTITVPSGEMAGDPSNCSRGGGGRVKRASARSPVTDAERDRQI